MNWKTLKRLFILVIFLMMNCALGSNTMAATNKQNEAKPIAPKGLKAEYKYSEKEKKMVVELTWGAPTQDSKNVSAYIVKKKNDTEPDLSSNWKRVTDFGTKELKTIDVNVTQNCTYQYLCKYINKNGVISAESERVTISLKKLPNVITSTVQLESDTTVVVKGKITRSGDSVIKEYGFIWAESRDSILNWYGEDSSLVHRVKTGSTVATVPVDISNRITSLSKGKTYYFCTYAINDAGVAKGEVKSIIAMKKVILTGQTKEIRNQVKFGEVIEITGKIESQEPLSVVDINIKGPDKYTSLGDIRFDKLNENPPKPLMSFDLNTYGNINTGNDANLIKKPGKYWITIYAKTQSMELAEFVLPEKEIDVLAPDSGYWITLDNNEKIWLKADPLKGDWSMDTDEDGKTDLQELIVPPAKGLWKYNSNPAKKDTDGDGVNDRDDDKPLVYQAFRALSSNSEKGNAGDTFTIFVLANSKDYNPVVSFKSFDNRTFINYEDIMTSETLRNKFKMGYDEPDKKINGLYRFRADITINEGGKADNYLREFKIIGKNISDGKLLESETKLITVMPDIVLSGVNNNGILTDTKDISIVYNYNKYKKLNLILKNISGQRNIVEIPLNQTGKSRIALDTTYFANGKYSLFVEGLLHKDSSIYEENIGISNVFEVRLQNTLALSIEPRDEVQYGSFYAWINYKNSSENVYYELEYVDDTKVSENTRKSQPNKYLGPFKIVADSFSGKVIITTYTIGDDGTSRCNTVSKTFTISKGLNPTITIILEIDNTNMIVDGTEQPIDPDRNLAPQLYFSRVLMPFRSVIQKLGGTVVWDKSSQKVTAELNGNILVFWLNNNEVLVNDEQTYSDVMPMLVSDSVLLPLRFVSEALGFEVDFNYQYNKILIKSIERKD